MTIEERGMPFHKNSFKQGNMFILFKVKFPQQLVGDEMEEVKACLSKLDGMDVREEEPDQSINDVKQMKKYDVNQRNSHHQGGNQANDSDEEKEEPSQGGMPGMA